jgi:tetratricopeptide (TPR) repeat protein/KaiC/GvpD/RAD55 family RecA-like ATPase
VQRVRKGVLSEPEFVGREKELQELEEFLNSAIEGKGHTIFVSGEAGSGKTRLSREFLRAAQKRGVAVLSGWCLSDAAVPYFPFIEAFNAFFGSLEEKQADFPQLTTKFEGSLQVGIEEREMATWLTGPKLSEKMGKVEYLSPQVWKDQAFDRVAKTLLSISVQIPLVLFLEDIQWADSASLALLHYISRVVSNSERILVLTTFRSEEVTADGEGRPHLLEEEMRLMSREDLFSEIKLSNLDQKNVSVITQSMMGGRVQQELVDKLAKESNGNALFLIESLRMLVERKNIVKENNEWRLVFDELGIPSKIKDIILRRLAVLKYTQRRVLDAASVIGGKFDPELLSSVLGQDSLDVIETLNFIAQSTSIVTVDEALYRFDHARSREVLYEALSLPLRRGYHARVAETLESANENGKIPYADLAYHYTHAGNEEKALKFSLEAGKDALARFSNREAINSFQFVIQKVGDKSDHFGQETVALEGLGDAFYANNNFREAKETYEKLAAIQKGADKLRALRKAIVAAFYEGDLPKIKELTQVAEENSSSDRVEAARILSHKARAGGLQLQFSYCMELMTQTISVYEEEYCLPDLAWDLFVMGGLAPQFGEPEKGVASSLRSLALYDELGDIHSQLEAQLYTANCFAYCGLYEEAIRSFYKVIEIDKRFKMNDYVRLIPAHINLAIRLFWKDPKEAKILGLKALEYCEKTDARFLGGVYEFLTDESVVTGDAAGREEYFTKLMSLPQNLLSSPRTQVLLERTKAFYFAGINQFDEAEKCYRNYLAILKKFMPSPGMEVDAMLCYSWILNKQGRETEAKAVSEQAQVLSESAQQKFAHVSIHAGLVTFTHPKIDETFEIRLDLVNVSRRQGSIVRVENLLVPGFRVVDVSPNCFVNNGYVEFKDNSIEPFEVKTIKLKVAGVKPGSFNLYPEAVYVDDLGQAKKSDTRQFTITVQAPQPAFKTEKGRISTGSAELDGLLLGGIPENYAVALSSSSCDERQVLIERFLEAGAAAEETVLYITGEAGNIQNLSKQIATNFFAIVCNLQAELMLHGLPNVYLLKGTDNLTEIDIAVTKYFRTLDPAQVSPRRACIDLVSDVLLQHHAVVTRKWLNSLILNLKAHRFTVLGVINPQMHQPEESQAILSLFDGEIEIIDRGLSKTLRVRKLYYQKYSENELTLNR